MPDSRMDQNNSRLSGAGSLSTTRNGNFDKAQRVRGETGYDSVQ